MTRALSQTELGRQRLDQARERLDRWTTEVGEAIINGEGTETTDGQKQVGATELPQAGDRQRARDDPPLRFQPLRNDENAQTEPRTAVQSDRVGSQTTHDHNHQ